MRLFPDEFQHEDIQEYFKNYFKKNINDRFVGSNILNATPSLLQNYPKAGPLWYVYSNKVIAGDEDKTQGVPPLTIFENFLKKFTMTNEDNKDLQDIKEKAKEVFSLIQKQSRIFQIFIHPEELRKNVYFARSQSHPIIDVKILDKEKKITKTNDSLEIIRFFMTDPKNFIQNNLLITTKLSMCIDKDSNATNNPHHCLKKDEQIDPIIKIVQNEFIDDESHPNAYKSLRRLQVRLLLHPNFLKDPEKIFIKNYFWNDGQLSHSASPEYEKELDELVRLMIALRQKMIESGSMASGGTHFPRELYDHSKKSAGLH